MAQEQVILTLRVDGVDKAITSTQQLNDEIKLLEQQLAKEAVGTKRYRELNTQLGAARRTAAQLGGDVQKTGGAFQRLDAGIGKAVQSFGALRVAIAATGIGALIQLIVGIVQQFGKFDAVADLLDRGLGALSQTFTQVAVAIERIINLDFSGALNAVTTELAANIAANDALIQKLDEVEEAERGLLEVRANANKEVAVALAAAKRRDLSIEERIKLLRRAGEAEQRAFDLELKLAKDRADALTAQAAISNATNQILDDAANARARVLDLEGQGLALRERIAAREAALLESEKAQEKQRAEEAAKRRAAEIDAQLALVKARNALAEAELGNEQTLEAQLERIRLKQSTAEAEFNARRAKGEKVLAQEIAAVRQQFDNERDAARKAQLEKDLAGIAARAEAEKAALKEISQAALAEQQAIVSDTSRTAEERVRAELRVLEIKRAQIELDRQQRLSAEGLSKAQIDAINATADEAIRAAERASAASQAKVGKTPGGLIGQLFGFSEDDFKAFEKKVAGVEQLAQGLGQTFAALGELQAQQTQAAIAGLTEQAEFAQKLAADAEAQAQESANRQEALEGRLFAARADQRQRILRLIERERQAQARQNAEAQAQTQQARQRQEEIKQLQREQAESQKLLQSFNVLVNTASAIVGFLATPGGFPGVALSVAAGITGAAQLAVINSTPVPGFAQGGFTGSGFGRADQSGFRPAGIVHAGEYVVPKRLVDSPRIKPIVQQLERERVKGYASGGNVAGPDLAAALRDARIVVSVEAIDEVRADTQRVEALAKL